MVASSRWATASATNEVVSPRHVRVHARVNCNLLAPRAIPTTWSRDSNLSCLAMIAVVVVDKACLRHDNLAASAYHRPLLTRWITAYVRRATSRRIIDATVVSREFAPRARLRPEHTIDCTIMQHIGMQHITWRSGTTSTRLMLPETAPVTGRGRSGSNDIISKCQKP